MLYNRASPKDRQSEIRTKVPDRAYTELVVISQKAGKTVYQTAREFILAGLAKMPGIEINEAEESGRTRGAEPPAN